jgi:ferric-dicitrate binding protein FerR (iron transport regulator)
MGNVTSPEELAERRRERQRAKIIAELERQANAQANKYLRPREMRRRYLLEILLVLFTIAVSGGILVAGKVLADLAANESSRFGEMTRVETQ